MSRAPLRDEVAAILASRLCWRRCPTPGMVELFRRTPDGGHWVEVPFTVDAIRGFAA